MKKNWKKVQMHELAIVNPESINKNFGFSEIEYIDISSVGTGILLESKNISIDSAPSRAKRLVKNGDTILSTVRPNRRSFLFIKKSKPNLVVSTGFAVLRPKENTYSKFLYYLINDRRLSDYLSARAKGAAYPAVDTEIIEGAEFVVPADKIEQIAIGHFLSNYDDLIENNNRRIKFLEKIAGLIFNEWFVKFRFPGYKDVKMVDSEFGKIPSEWEIKAVKSLLKRFPSGEKYTQDNAIEEGSVPIIDQSEKELLGFHDNEPDHKASPEKPILIFGDHTCKMKIMVEPFSVGPNTIPFISIEHSESYIYFLIKNLVHTQEYKRHWNDLITKRVVVPNAELSEKFSQYVTEMIQQLMLLQRKNMNLAKTRDLLLPKLISGEIDVSGLNIAVSEVEA